MTSKRAGISAVNALLTITFGLGMVACSSEEAPTAPPAGDRPEMAVAKTYTAMDLGILSPGLVRGSLAEDINAAGQVVGLSTVGSGSLEVHAFLWQKGVMTDLGTLGGNFSQALGINPAGQVVGISQIAEGITDPFVFLWEKGVMTDLGFEGRTNESPVGINPAGRVAESSGITAS